MLIIFSLLDDVAAAPEAEARVPRYLACNRDRFPYCTVLHCTVMYCTALYCTVLYRFPYWFGRPDPRNAVLSADLRRFRRLHRFSVTNKCPFLYNLAYVTVNGSSFGAVRTCPETAGA